MKKNELRTIAKNKDRFLDIMNLLKHKEYNKIFDSYGQRVYCLVVPRSYKKKDINRLMQEGKFKDIYWKYGRGTYNDYIYKMQQIDVYS